MDNYLMYCSTNQFSVLRTLFDVDSKIFNLFTWYFSNDSISCTVINDINTIITNTELNSFDKFYIKKPFSITIEPKVLFTNVFKGKSKKNRYVLEMYIAINEPTILHMIVTDIVNDVMIKTNFKYYMPNNIEQNLASFPTFPTNFSFTIKSEVLHRYLKEFKALNPTIELVLNKKCIQLKCENDFKVNAVTTIHEHENLALFSNIDTEYSFGHFDIAQINKFQKLRNYSNSIEIRLMKNEQQLMPIIFIYDIGSLGKKSLIIKPAVT